jgi:hypothetical protein
MRNPYHVGRWVRGRNHYGRRMLIESLLESDETATWVVGTRRLGKTSLLRQLEWTALRGRVKTGNTTYLPIYWDLQGCETPDDLAYELDLSLEDRRAELTELGVELDHLPTHNAVAVLRSLARAIAEHNENGDNDCEDGCQAGCEAGVENGQAEKRQVRILLLIDEAEALLTVARHDARWLGTLRKALLEGEIRTILTSTRLLSQLNQLNAAWNTSPFLFGFKLVHLWALGPEMATALIRQTQGASVRVEDRLVAQILAYCNGHPYLIQYLCERLFASHVPGEGTLQPIEEQHLEVDHMLAGFFSIDFRNMTRVERRILLTLSKLTLASEREILNTLYDIAPPRIRLFLYGLSRLGYVRRIKSQWTIGNEFLRRWLQESHDDLARRLDSVLDEAQEEDHLRDGARDEVERLRWKIAQLERELAVLARRLQDATANMRGQLRSRMERIQAELDRLRRALERADQAEDAPDDPDRGE